MAGEALLVASPISSRSRFQVFHFVLDVLHEKGNFLDHFVEILFTRVACRDRTVCNQEFFFCSCQCFLKTAALSDSNLMRPLQWVTRAKGRQGRFLADNNSENIEVWILL